MVAIDWRKSWSNLPSDGCGRLGFQDAQVGSMASHRRQPWQVYYRPQQPFIAAGAAAYLSGRLVVALLHKEKRQRMIGNRLRAATSDVEAHSEAAMPDRSGPIDTQLPRAPLLDATKSDGRAGVASSSTMTIHSGP